MDAIGFVLMEMRKTFRRHY